MGLIPGLLAVSPGQACLSNGPLRCKRTQEEVGAGTRRLTADQARGYSPFNHVTETIRVSSTRDNPTSLTAAVLGTAAELVDGHGWAGTGPRGFSNGSLSTDRYLLRSEGLSFHSRGGAAR